MLLELAKPDTLLSCILSLLAVFHAAFLGPSIDIHQRIWDSVAMLVLADGISLISGLVFCDGLRDHRASASLANTFPVQIFCWAAGGMIVLFLLSWYLETHFILYKDVRF